MLTTPLRVVALVGLLALPVPSALSASTRSPAAEASTTATIAPAAAPIAIAPTVAPPPTIDVGSDGLDGPFGANPFFVPDVFGGNTMTIDLGLATRGAGVTWQTPGSGRGVYDANKWAVVFKYATVDVPAGKTVKFKNNDSNAPVVWLVQGDVTIAGTIDVSGEDGTDGRNSTPGPGGFRGGIGDGFGFSTNLAASGFGPGGGRLAAAAGSGVSGSYATLGTNGMTQDTYGNAQILPLIGGSGGAGTLSSSTGGAGGGAILIASNNLITIAANGSILADGGGRSCASAGSGGAIRLIAPTISGAGSLFARGGVANCSSTNVGGFGRIRLEADVGGVNSIPRATTVPIDVPPLIWPPNTAPTATITSIDGRSVIGDPGASIDSGNADIDVPSAGATTILVDCRRVPITATVIVLVKPKFGNTIPATATRLSGDIVQSQWSATVNLPNGFAVLQVHASF